MEKSDTYLMKRLASVLVACALGISLVPSAASAKDKGEVFLLNSVGLPMVPGQSGWNGAIWKAGDDELTEFSVTVKAPAGWGVTYPENRVTDTSLWDNDTLSADEVDFTAFRLTVPENTPVSTSHALELYVTYSYLKNGKKEKVVNKRFTVNVPVVAPQNPAFNQMTASLGQLAADSQTWVDVSYKGRSTAFDFKLSVTDPAGAGIVYPNDGTFTSLNGDSVLEVGEIDRASFLLDTTGLAPGVYTMTTNVAHRVATQAKNVSGNLSFEVVAASPAPSRAPAAAASAPGSPRFDIQPGARSHRRLAEVEARRLCDVGTTTFFSTDALEAQLAARVTDAGHSLARYEEWRAQLSRHPRIRARVFNIYQRVCGT